MALKYIISASLLAFAPFTLADDSSRTPSLPTIASKGTVEATSTTGLNSGDFAITQSLSSAQVVLYSLVVAGAITWVSYETYKNTTGQEPSSSTGTIIP